jgi:hypothetical protein
MEAIHKKLNIMKRLNIFIILISIALSASSQNLVDALRYSQTFPGSSARALSMGGAFGSFGGDVSSLSINPAGIGVFRKSEFSVTPGFIYSIDKADYKSGNAEDFKYAFKLNSIGIISALNNKKNSDLAGFNIGFTYNRIKDFNNNIMIEGVNSDNSLADFFMDNSNGLDPEELDAFYERLAFDAYVIDTIPGSAFEYDTPVLLPITQRKTIHTEGGMGDWALSLGANINHKLYVGASFGFISVRYKELSVHSEYDDLNHNDFDNFRFSEELTTEGSGFNLKAGFIVKPVNLLRIGGSVNFPTRIKLRDEYYSTMRSAFDNGNSYTVYPTYSDGSRYDVWLSDYDLVTPLKINGSLGLQIDKIALLGFDIEFVDYSTARLREIDVVYDFSDRNTEIQETYKSVINIKTGAEVRTGQLSYRGGFAYYPSPFRSSEINKDASRIDITAGLGFRDKKYFFDLGGVYSLQEEKYSLYYDNIASISRAKFMLLATAGIRF